MGITGTWFTGWNETTFYKEEWKIHFFPLQSSAEDLSEASGGELQTIADRLSSTFSEPNSHQMISLKLINDLKMKSCFLCVSFMNEEATNDLLPVWHVF